MNSVFQDSDRVAGAIYMFVVLINHHQLAVFQASLHAEFHKARSGWDSTRARSSEFNGSV